MTFKDFAMGTLNLPGKVFRGLVALTLGDYDRNEDGTPKRKGVFRGLLGLILDGFKLLLSLGQAIGRMATNFVTNHVTAIGTAFWMSLLIGGAAALTVAFWPAALAAVTGFTIAGYSIASVVGAGFAAQVAATAGVGAILASAAVYAIATVVNLITAIKNCFTKKPDSANEGEFEPQYPQDGHDSDEFRGSANAMSPLHTHETESDLKTSFDAQPLHMHSPIHTAAKKGQEAELDTTHAATAAM